MESPVKPPIPFQADGWRSDQHAQNPRIAVLNRKPIKDSPSSSVL